MHILYYFSLNIHSFPWSAQINLCIFKTTYIILVNLWAVAQEKITDSQYWIFEEFPQKSQIWQSETSPNKGIPNQVPCLGLACLTLPNLGFWGAFFKYPKISKNGNLLFFPVLKAVRSVASGGKFYRLPPDKENTELWWFKRAISVIPKLMPLEFLFFNDTLQSTKFTPLPALKVLYNCAGFLDKIVREVKFWGWPDY